MLWNVRSVRARSGIFLPQVSTFPISQPQDGGHVEVHAKTKGLDISKKIHNCGSKREENK
jgi:hypothetical protein